MTTKPTYSRTEIKQREELLTKCFQACDFNNDGFIDPPELDIVARCFNPSSTNTDQECKVIFAKLDKNQDGRIDQREWVSVLFDLFRFQCTSAFEKHVQELLTIIETKAAEVKAATPANNTSSSSSSASAAGGSLGTSPAIHAVAAR